MATFDELSAYAQNPNVRRFLDVISAAEGTNTNGYNTAFGGGRIDSLADHPRQLHSFTQTDGTPNKTSAAGRYQFLGSTWDDVAGKLGLSDFGPQNQDVAAVELLRRNGALPALLAGDFDTAVQKSGGTWASLPSSPYAQPKRSPGFIASTLDSAAQAIFPSAQAAGVPQPQQQQRQPTAWKDVIAKPEFQALSPEQQAAAQAQYFDQVVAPRVPQGQLDAARGQFMQQYGRSAAPTSAKAAPVVPATTNQQIVASAPMRVLKGAKDVWDSGAQMLSHAVPDGVADAINAGTQYVNDLPVIGPISKAFGFVPATPQELDQRLIQDEKNYQDARAATGQSGIDAYRLAGNVAGTAPLLAGAGGAAVSLPGRLAAGTAAGTAGGLLNPALGEGGYAEQKGQQALLGGAFGLGGGLLGAGISRLVAPGAARNPQVQTLLNEGVTPTPGQLMGGVARTAEDRAMSVPILGDAIRAARTRGVEDYNRAALNRAVAPLGQKVTAIGHEGLQQVDDIIRGAYDDLLPKLQFKADAQFGRELGKLQNMARSLPDGGRQFENVVTNQVGSRLLNGRADGIAYKQIESEIGRLASSYRSSADAAQRDLGMALGELQNSLRSALTRANPSNAGDLSKINKAYGQMTRLQRAASSVGADNGVFTPSQFSSAVRAADTTARKNAYGRGAAMMQDLSDAGRSVMNSQIPNSGTVDRAMLGAGALGSGLINPAIPAGLLGAAIPYLPGVSKAVASAMARRPDIALRAGGLLEGVVPAMGGLLGLGAAPR